MRCSSKAYGDPSLVQKVAESPDSDIKAIGGALLDIAPEWAKLRGAVRRGTIPADMDQTGNLIAAANLVERARQEGVKLGDLTSQRDVFTGQSIDPLTESWSAADVPQHRRMEAAGGAEVSFRGNPALYAGSGQSGWGRKPARIAADLAGGVLSRSRRGDRNLAERPILRPAYLAMARVFEAQAAKEPDPKLRAMRLREAGQTVETGGRAGTPAGPGPVESFPRDQGFKFTRGLKAAMSNITNDVRAYAARIGLPLAYEPVNGAKVAASFVMERGRQTGNESMVLVHPNGELEAHTSEQGEVVTFGEKTIGMLNDPESRVISFHNHPSNNGPSAPDVVALNYPGHAAMVVITSTGDFHAARLALPLKNDAGKFSQPVGRLEFQLAAYNAGKAADKYGYPLFEKGEIHPEEGGRLRAYVRNAALDRAGLIDYTTSYEVPVQHRV